MDWAVTARMREPHVRVHVAERTLTTWLLLDTSPSMSFGTADRRKIDVAEGAALAIGTSRLARQPARRAAVRRREAHSPCARARAAAACSVCSSRSAPTAPDGLGATSLGEALTRAAHLARQRGLVVIVSEFRGPRDWQSRSSSC